MLLLLLLGTGCVEPEDTGYQVSMTEKRASVWLYFTCIWDTPCDVQVSASGTSKDRQGKHSLDEVVDVYLHEEIIFGGGINFYKQRAAGTAPEDGELELHAQADVGATFFIELVRPDATEWSSSVVELRTEPFVAIFETFGPDRNAM